MTTDRCPLCGGTPRGSQKPERDAELDRLNRSGISKVALGRRFNLSTERVRTIIKRERARI